MADSVLRGENVQESFQIIGSNIEWEIKKRLTWSRNRWSEEGELESRMHKLSNSLRYWGRKLAKAKGERNVIFCLYNRDKDVNIELEEIFEEIDKLGCGMKMRGFTSFRNPKYLSIAFDTVETTQFIEKHLRYVGESNVIYLSWALNSGSTDLKLHWVPTDISDQNIINYLKKYVNITEYIRDDRVFLNGRILKGGIMSFKVILKDLVKIEEIPHLCVIDGNELLITIQGRKILCLNCGLLGHRSADCPTPFCRECKRMQSKEHSCTRGGGSSLSYAEVLKDEIYSEQQEAMRNTDGKILISNADTEIKICESTTAVVTTKTVEEDKLSDGLSLQADKVGKVNRVIDEMDILGVPSGGGWGDSETPIADQEESAESGDDNSDSEKEAFSKVEDYLLELKKLNAGEFENTLSKIKSETAENKTLQNTGESMDVISGSSKRKIQDISKPGRIPTIRMGNRKTYSKRGGGRATTAVSENLFQSIVDKGGGK